MKNQRKHPAPPLLPSVVRGRGPRVRCGPQITIGPGGDGGPVHSCDAANREEKSKRLKRRREERSNQLQFS